METPANSPAEKSVLLVVCAGKIDKERAKMKGDLEDGAVEFGEKVTCDDIVSAGISKGTGGETVGKHFFGPGHRMA